MNWLRKLDLNQRPTGYEFATINTYNLHSKQRLSPLKLGFIGFSRYFNTCKMPTLSLIFCQGVKTLTKINCRKTAENKKTTFQHIKKNIQKIIIKSNIKNKSKNIIKTYITILGKNSVFKNTYKLYYINTVYLVSIFYKKRYRH